MIANFVAAIRDPEVKLIANGEEGIRSVEFGNAMLYSGLKGVDVEIPMDTVAYDAMLQDLIRNSKHTKKTAASKTVVNMANSF